VAGKRLVMSVVVGLAFATGAVAGDPISKLNLSKNERKASVLDYDNTTKLVIERKRGSEVAGDNGDLRKELADRAQAALHEKGFPITRTGNNLEARVRRGGMPEGELKVEVTFPQGAVLAGNPAAAVVVRVQWLGEIPIAKHPGSGVAEQHRDAERLRAALIDALLTDPSKPKAEEHKERVLLAVPAGSTVGDAAQFLDQIAKRVSGVNDKLKAKAGIVESRSDTDIVTKFDVDQIFAMAPAGMARANKHMPVRVMYTIRPEKPGESSIHVTVTDLTEGEIDKFPEYVTWEKTGPLGLILGGR
jgi:hypothetical protein